MEGDPHREHWEPYPWEELLHQYCGDDAAVLRPAMETWGCEGCWVVGLFCCTNRPSEGALELSDPRWPQSDPAALIVTFGATSSQSDKWGLVCSVLQKFILKQLLENFTIQKFHFPNSAAL